MARDGNKDFCLKVQVRACYAEMCATGLFTPEQERELRWGLHWENGAFKKNMKLIANMGDPKAKAIVDQLPPAGVYVSARVAGKATGYYPKQIQHECLTHKIKCYWLTNSDGLKVYYVPYKEVIALRRRRVEYEAKKNGTKKEIKVS